jgi:hypothetical protein
MSRIATTAAWGIGHEARDSSSQWAARMPPAPAPGRPLPRLPEKIPILRGRDELLLIPVKRSVAQRRMGSMRPTFDVERLLEPPEWRAGSPAQRGDRSRCGREPLEVVEVLGLVCAGLSVPQIAEHLGVTPGTISTLITRSLRRGSPASDELVARARQILGHSGPG